MAGSSVRSSVQSVVAAAALMLTGVTGCNVKSFIDPAEMGRYEHPALQRHILTSLSSIDKSIDDPKDEFVNATEARPEDLNTISRDYVIGKSDLVAASVTDLVGPGVESTKTTRVSESGNISLPLIGQIHAEGVTEAQLEQTIVDAYKNANLIQNAQVSVTVVEARARTFSVLGAVTAPGQYAILQSDFRILDALVLARDVLQQVETIYVIRQIDQEAGRNTGGTPGPRGGQGGPGGGSIDPLAPRSQATFGDTKLALLQTAGGSGAGGAAGSGTTGDQQLVLPDGQSPAGANPAPGTPPAPAAPAAQPAPGGPSAVTPLTPPGAFQFASPQAPAETRVIRIPIAALKNGDLRYNIVIRPRDLILAPSPVIGEYYMGGHVQRVGVYSLSGRQITLKQAVVSAGMLDGLAIPQRMDLIRRLGADREVFARFNLDGIFSGTEPDIFLKPYDQVMVGTNILAPFIAAVRGGFRMTYGFGFLYDRNFAPIQQNNNN